MYRNYGNFGRGTDQNFPDNSSESVSSSASGIQTTSTGTTQRQEVGLSHSDLFILFMSLHKHGHKVTIRSVIKLCCDTGQN